MIEQPDLTAILDALEIAANHREAMLTIAKSLVTMGVTKTQHIQTVLFQVYCVVIAIERYKGV